MSQFFVWIKTDGVPNVPPIQGVYDQALLVAESMKTDIAIYYNGRDHHARACHTWHCITVDGTHEVRFGTLIHKYFWTMPNLSSQCPTFLWMYNQFLLKTTNTVVVEVMGKFISRQADFVRGLSFAR